MATRRALGRGLSALLSDNSLPIQAESISPGPVVVEGQLIGDQLLEVDIDLIDVNPEQPRTKFREDKLEELAQSIRANGLVQPILIRRAETGRYQLVAGERRWRASQRAGLHKISAIIRNISDGDLLELALVENIQRQELNPIEEAQAYQRLIVNLGTTQDEISKRVGKDRSSIANYLRLLKLPDLIQKMLEDERLSMGHARALLGVESVEHQKRLANDIIKKKLSVRETENLVRKLNSDEPVKGVSTPLRNDANIRAAELKLKRILGTQVRIHLSQHGGRLEIEFSSMGELDRVYSIIMRKTDPDGSYLETD